MTTSNEHNRRESSLAQVGIVTKYNFLNYFRARRFYVMFAIVLLISGLLTFVIAYRRPGEILTTDLGFLSTIWGSFVTLVVILSAAFFGGDAISGEFQNRTGYFLVPNPIRRSVIYVGKWFAALIASTIILLVYALISIGNSVYYFGFTLPNEFYLSMLFAWIYLVAALSFAFAFSALFKSSAISVLMSVILLLFVFNVVDTVAATFAGIEPWFSITYGASIITSILTVPYPAPVVTNSFGPRGGFSVTTYTAPVWEGLVILGVYFVVMAALGLWLFEKKEFTS
ncbi:MAG: ABC transporter permease [Thaumarchaeota archaeon]|nr:ABC transporter permease [Nitrososphaerota archaeon]